MAHLLASVSEKGNSTGMPKVTNYHIFVLSCFLVFLLSVWLMPANNLIEIIKALASLAWPLGTFATIYYFKDELKDVLRRLKKGEILGNKIELSDRIDQLDQTVEVASSSIPIKQFPETISEDNDSIDNETKRIIEDSIRSPKAALLLLSSDIEREARHILASSGLLDGKNFVSFGKMMNMLVERGSMPNDLMGSVKMFWDVRNRLIHGIPTGVESNDDMMRVIDIGSRLLKALKAVPRENKTVYLPDIAIYSDQDCTTLRDGIFGIMLETINSAHDTKAYRIYPTTMRNYKKGESVSWEWNMGMVVGESWYKHPETGKISHAWSQSAEFIGRHLTDI